MPTPTIKRLSDGKEADFWSLRPINPSTGQHEVQPLHRPNVEGIAFRILAKKGQPFRVIGVRDFASVNEARQSMQSLRDKLHGELAEFQTADGATFTRMMVIDVIERSIVPVARLVGSIGNVDGSGLWENAASSTTKAIGTVEIVMVHAGPESI